jgi:N4-gp56 family major capsid protein
MAATNIAANTSLQTKAWVSLAMRFERDSSFWFGENGFVGSGIRDATKPIHYVDQFTKVMGADKVVIPLVLPLTGGAVAGDNKMKGKEEALIPDAYEIRIDQVRKATRNSGRMADHRSIIDFQATAKDFLADWHAQTKDELAFLTLSGTSYSKNLDGSDRDPVDELPSLAFAADVATPSTNRKLFPGSVTATSGLASTDKMSWALLVKAKAYAILKRIKPIRQGGKDYWCVVMHPNQARDLKLDSDYKTIVSQAGERGDKNPLFAGHFAKVDGLYLFEHNKVPSTFGATSKWGAGSNVDGAQAMLFGAQALGYGAVNGAHDPQRADETDDYGAITGIEYYQMYGFRKPQFKSPYDAKATEDFSVLSLYTAAAQ